MSSALIKSDFLARWNSVLSRQQRKALRDIRDCRTAALGGHLQQCDRCGHRVILYNSCRNRIAPSARPRPAPGGSPNGRRSFCRSRISTSCSRCPSRSAAWHFRTAKQIYTILFRAASETLLEIAADPRLSRRLHRLPRRAAHLGSESASASAPALRRTRRRHLPRRLPLDRLPEVVLLSARARSQPPLPQDSSCDLLRTGVSQRHSSTSPANFVALAEPAAFQSLV